jgi:hypothetical protein
MEKVLEAMLKVETGFETSRLPPRSNTTARVRVGVVRGRTNKRKECQRLKYLHRLMSGNLKG